MTHPTMPLRKACIEASAHMNPKHDGLIVLVASVIPSP